MYESVSSVVYREKNMSYWYFYLTVSVVLIFFLFVISIISISGNKIRTENRQSDLKKIYEGHAKVIKKDIYYVEYVDVDTIRN